MTIQQNISIKTIGLSLLLASSFNSSLPARELDRVPPLVAEDNLLHHSSTFRQLITDCLERSKSLSCHRAGVYFINERGEFKNGVKYINASCELGRGYSCTLLGSYYQRGYGVKKNPILAKEYYNKGCLRESQQGCKKYKQLKIKYVKDKRNFVDKLFGKKGS